VSYPFTHTDFFRFFPAFTPTTAAVIHFIPADTRQHMNLKTKKDEISRISISLMNGLEKFLSKKRESSAHHEMKPFSLLFYGICYCYATYFFPICHLTVLRNESLEKKNLEKKKEIVSWKLKKKKIWNLYLREFKF
jgi:hypothetical protein